MDSTQILDDQATMFASAFVNTNHLSKKEFVSRAFEAVFSMIPEAEKGSYFELHEGYFEPVYSKGYDLELLSKLSFKSEDAFTDFESSSDQGIDAYETIIHERDGASLSAENIKVLKQLGTYGGFISLYAPIIFENAKIGVMCFDNFSQKRFSDSSKLTLKIYAQLMSNFYTLRMYQERSELRYQNIISALVSAIEIKDAYTKGHAKRVMDICEQIGTKLDYSIIRLNKLKNAAILHDVGKIGIATDILTKPGRLTDEEFKEIKLHPEKAKHILEKIEDFEDITDLAYCHHEHYDGKGYPRGLKGDEIPFDAQIIQLADAFDAMTSERAYREAFTVEKALEIIRKESGKQFHPDLVNILIELLT